MAKMAVLYLKTSRQHNPRGKKNYIASKILVRFLSFLFLAVYCTMYCTVLYICFFLGPKVMLWTRFYRYFVGGRVGSSRN